MNPSQNEKEEGELEEKQKNGSHKEQKEAVTEYMRRIPTSQWASRSSDLYEKVHQVGEGTFGKVYKAKYKSQQAGKNIVQGDHVALKRILMDNEKEGFPITAIREIMILKRLEHQNIINLIEIVTSKPSEKNKFRGNVYLVFEYMEHDLAGLLNIKLSFNVSQVKCILHQVLSGVQYMHSNNIIHRDIKGANILINNKGDVKIADFGLARIFNPNPNVNKRYTNRVVTLWYRSPELLLGSTDYGPAVDVWSVGCLFSELLTGVTPFRGEKEIEQIEKIFEKCGTPTEETWPGVTKLEKYNSLCPKQMYPKTLKAHYLDNKKVSDLAFDLLNKMLELDPSKRISAKDALEHIYFREEPSKGFPRDLPRIEKDSHEYESRLNKKQNLPQQVRGNQNAQGEMMAARHGYNNPQYYNRNMHEAKYKIEETKLSVSVNVNTTQQGNANFPISNRLESLLPSSQPDANSLLSNKRIMESSLESESVSFKKQRLSPDNK